MPYPSLNLSNSEKTLTTFTQYTYKMFKQMFTRKHEEGDDAAFMLEILELDGAHGGPRRDILQ